MVHIPQIIDTLSRSVCNKEVKFVSIFSLEGRNFVSVVRIRDGPYYGRFF